MAKQLKIITLEADTVGQVLIPDKDGYYDVNAGALNVENTSGIFYKSDADVLKIFTSPESFLVKKIKAKELYGELDHPEHSVEKYGNLNTDEGKRKWMMRQAKFDKDRQTHHIKSVRLVQTDIKDIKTGAKKILLKMKVKPFGAMKQVLIDSFANKDISTAFSIRAAATEEVSHGRIVRKLVMVFTFDFVGSPGIKGSNDQDTLVSEMDQSSIGVLETMAEEFRGTANESSALAMDSLINQIKCVDKTSLIQEWK